MDSTDMCSRHGDKGFSMKTTDAMERCNGEEWAERESVKERMEGRKEEKKKEEGKGKGKDIPW